MVTNTRNSRLLSRIGLTQRLVKNPAIKAKHRFRGRVASGRKEVVYNNDLSVHTLTHFLYLVIFLDCAKVMVGRRSVRGRGGGGGARGIPGAYLLGIIPSFVPY